MTKNPKTPSQTSEAPADDLTPEQLEQVSAGADGSVLVAMGDGSVRTGVVDAADYVIWRKTLGTGG